MSENTKIEWCDATVNLWQGCDKVSPGCLHCYAATLDHRFFKGENWKGKRLDKRGSGTRLAMKLNRKAAKLGIRYRVFNGSVNDWLDHKIPIEWLAHLLNLIHLTPNLDWLLLTKRPQNFRSRIHAAFMETGCGSMDADNMMSEWEDGRPPANVWIGTTVEDQKRADERIPLLLSIPARIRFLSCEPLLEEVEIRTIDDEQGRYAVSLQNPTANRIHWVIVGGESGPGARPMHPEWARSLRDQCRFAQVAFFMKQMGGARKPFEPIPGDLMIREFPKGGEDG